MATPVFKFHHPDFQNEDLFFIQNTYYELPETIPMDLTTFVYYHYETDRTLEGFFYFWDDLMKTGSSIEDIDFETWFNKEEKSKLYQDATASSAIQNAIANNVTSNKIKTFIQEKKFEQENFYSFFFEVTDIGNSTFRDVDYYQSRHYLFDYLQTLKEDNQQNNKDELENGDFLVENDNINGYGITKNYDDLFEFQFTLEYIDINNFDQEDLLISLYNNENTHIPLHLIPHKYRNSGFFRDECLSNDEFYLIPF
jgi:hypothetical protein